MSSPGDGLRRVSVIGHPSTMNINTITGWTIQSGSTYHRPSAIISPRIFKLSARYWS